MKKLSIIYALCIIMASVLTFVSCTHKKDEKQKTDIAVSSITKDDIAYVKACLDQLDLIEYGSKDSFMTAISIEKSVYTADSIVQHIPISTLERIADVVYAKYGYITKRLIAKEYDESYNNVYKYLEVKIQNDTTDYERE